MSSRVVKAHAVRKNEILDRAERLFATAGYERTTINAIIDAAGIAKGTFYHYFAGKEDLLDSLVERLAANIVAALTPILDDRTPATDKLRRLHETAGSIKSGQPQLLMQYLRAAYRPENLLARHRMNERALQATIPLYARIIRQGIDEGCFRAAQPDETAEILLRAWTAIGDAIAELLLQGADRPASLQKAGGMLAAYDEVAERALGAAPGSLGLAAAARRTLESLGQNLAHAAPAGGNGGRS